MVQWATLIASVQWSGYRYVTPCHWIEYFVHLRQWKRMKKILTTDPMKIKSVHVNHWRYSRKYLTVFMFRSFIFCSFTKYINLENTTPCKQVIEVNLHYIRKPLYQFDFWFGFLEFSKIFPNINLHQGKIWNYRPILNKHKSALRNYIHRIVT